MALHAQQFYSAAQVHLREAERLRKKNVPFALSWFPFFTNLDSLRFVERQIIVLQAILKQGAALQEMETSA